MYQWRRHVFLAPALRMPLGSPYVLAQGVLLDAEVQRRSSRGGGYPEIGVARLGPGEEEEMSDAQGSGHGDIVAKAIGTPLLQTTRGPGLHHHAHIFRQLANARPDLARANADDHALGILGYRGQAAWQRGFVPWIFCAHMGSFFCSWLRHRKPLSAELHPSR